MKERFDKDWHYLARSLGYGNKHEMLTDMYVTQALSLHQIGARLGCSPHCVGRNLQREQIDRRSKGGRNNPSYQTRKLYMLDQRVMLGKDFTLVARGAGVSTSLLYHYRRLMKEGTWNSVQSAPSPA
jgi:hypothetical protein